MGRVKQQHYVPKAYLQNFSIDLNKKQIYFFDKKTSKQGRVNINNIAKEKDFYVDKSQADIDVFEKYYSTEVEPMLAKCLREILGITNLCTNETRIISESTKKMFSNLIVYQMLRTPKARTFSRNIAEEVIKSLMPEFEKIANSKDKKKVLNKYRNLSNDTFKQLSLPLITANERIEKFGMVLNSMLWTVYYNCNEEPFIISDNPVLIYENNSEKIGIGHVGIGNNSTIVVFPISPKIALFLIHKNSIFGEVFEGFENKLIRIEEGKIIRELNRLQLLQCNRQIYSNEPFISSLID